MNRKRLIGLCLGVSGCLGLPLSAAPGAYGTPEAASQRPQRPERPARPERPSGARESFRKYREQLLSDYSEFREKVLANYAEFLAGVWVEYEKGFEPSPKETPKPTVLPVCDESEPAPAPVALPVPKPKPEPVKMALIDPRPAPLPVKAENPDPVLRNILLPDQVIEEEKMQLADTGESRVGGTEAPLPEGGLRKTTLPASEERPQGGRERGENDVEFRFYDMTLTAPDLKIDIARKLSSTEEFAAQWTHLVSDPAVPALASSLSEIAGEYGLNDYLTFIFTKAYVDSRFAGYHSTSRASLTQCLLAHMGSGVRVAVNEDGEGVLLFPPQQTIYDRLYLNIDGQRYYAFYDDLGFDYNKMIYCCQLPKGVDAGRAGDMTINGLSLPYKPHPYNLKVGDITVSGEVNANIFPMLFRYPCMDMGNYAASTLLPSVREDIVEQLRAQLSGTDNQKVNSLLRFTQKAFKYSTDQDAWGFEKPYFLEESLFYPVNDCEDRSIFYSYLLWNVLGRENHVINYPGHEAVAVSLAEPITGDSYVYEGSTFFISDPTYIGASTGRAMSEYRTVTPTIDYIYK